MRIYDIAIIGAGPAGIMAALRASQLNKDVILIEKNNRIGKKLSITGKGRCNVTNTASVDVFVEKFGRQGPFLRSAFSRFFNKELMALFKSRGLRLKVERQGRVFPATDKAESVVEILENSLGEGGPRVLYNARVRELSKEESVFRLDIVNGNDVRAKKVILAAGGASYEATGSAGEGFRMAGKFGHTIRPLAPALVPLKTKESWVKQLQGLTLKNARITFAYDKKKVVSGIGELLFTHFGISGPLVLDLSGRIVALLAEHPIVRLFIDLKPALEPEKLESRLSREFNAMGKTHFKNIMKDLLPHKLIPVFIKLSGIDPAKTGSQIARHERGACVRLLKGLPLTVTGSLGIAHGMVTGGGVSTGEIDPRTMESRLIRGLYFAGEIIDGCAPSGGYNLQQAFSTGYLAGEEAAYA